MKLRVALPVFLLTISVAGALGLAVLTLPSRDDIVNQKPFEQRIRDYLVSNPGVLMEVAAVIERRNAEQRVAQRRKTLSAFRNVIRAPRGLPVWGNPNGDVTVVEFFDYRCPYCKRSLDQVRELVKSDPNIRVVLKEYPILGPESVFAAEVAIASVEQGKYLETHMALMSAGGRFDRESILALAQGLGLDMARLRADMKKPKVKKVIREARVLADKLAISGTPAFIVGDELLPGYADLVTLKKLVLAARKRCVTC